MNRTWDSFVTYRSSNGSGVWAHDFGTYNECIPGQTLNGAHANAARTSVTSQPTMTYRIVDSCLTEKLGPPVTFSGLPVPFCEAGGNDGRNPRFVGMTPYAGGQLVLADGTHLVTTMYPSCAPGTRSRNGGISIFSSADGYNFTFVANVARQSDSKVFAAPAEGPNEHTLALLLNGDIVCVFRTEAGDGNGRYGPYYRTVSTDAGKTWSTAIPLKDTSGNYIGCARPHMVQLGNVTLLVGGRMMMGHDYSRSFSIWMSTDGNAENWTRADGSYHHNARASETHAGLWPSSVNRTGWRFEFTSGYIGLVRLGESSAAVIYDLMLPQPPPPPAPPRPPGQCTTHIHHTLGCFNDADGTLILSHLAPAPVGAAVTLASCGAACYALKPHANFTIAGIDDGKSCFCGAPSDMETAAAKARSVDKTQCIGTPCGGDPKETECGGPGRLLAYSYTCDGDENDAVDAIQSPHSGHNPSTSYSMRIDLVGV